MSHKLSTEHKNICKKIREYKLSNKENKEEQYLILEKPTFDLILKSKLTATSKIILFFLLSKVDFNYKHLYVFYLIQC